MEKQKIALNFAHLQNEVQEIKKHVRSATDRIPEIRFKHANLFKLVPNLLSNFFLVYVGHFVSLVIIHATFH